MNKTRHLSLLTCIITLLMISTEASSQSKCGTVMLQEMQLNGKDYREAEQEFESWLSKKLDEKSQLQSLATRTNELVTLPVVVHVIHNGEPVGTGSNIPDEQISSQIEVLNQDFRRQNPDASETLSEFVSVAADTQIEFTLAKRDPEGLPTTGIVRVQGSQSEFSIFEQELLKSQSFWPSEDYLNIWVVNLGNQLLGFAQFPVSNLEGLSVQDDNDRRIDGVVVNYPFFGVGFNTDPFSRGRTATHEIGHFLGLRHVWGDGGCSFDDFCTDTPFMGDNSSGCPGSPDTCPLDPLPDMYQNYMDFTDDVCMNLFTECQSLRMRAVLEESPRRKSLLTSKGGIEPIMVANDLGIRRIISPEVSVCSSTITPEVELRNYGTNDINAFAVSLSIDGVVVETIESTASLSPLAILSVPFKTIDVSEGNEFNYTFQIVETNSGIDGNSENDQKSVYVQVPFVASLPEFDDLETDVRWLTRRLTGGPADWELSNANRDVANNTAYKLDLFNADPEAFGNLDMLVSPVIDLEKVNSAEMSFQYAYAPVDGNFVDGLTVAVLTECGINFSNDNVISSFDLFGSQLATTTTQTGEFMPTGISDWREVNINLNQFLGLNNIQVALIAQNGGGNNIYVDEIEILAGSQFSIDVKVDNVRELPEISCRTFQSPIVEVKNFGTQMVNSLNYIFGVPGDIRSGQINNINLLPGESQEIAVGVPNLSEGEFEFAFSVIGVNNQADEDPSDNILTQTFRITEQEEIIPLRERFEQRTFNELSWFPFSLSGDHDWSFSDLNNNGVENQSISIDAFNLSEEGKQNWLVSPKLDLSGLMEASMQFDYSYAQRLDIEDRLEILISTDCGRTFGTLAFSRQGADLAVTSSETEWIPRTSSDWIRESIDLSAYANLSEVLVAFVFTNANGNNFYLDNLDFFVSSDPIVLSAEEVTVRAFPNPTIDEFNLVFNLEEREQVTVRLVDMMGNQILNADLQNVLNQTFNYEAFNLRSGLYLVQVIGETFRRTERVVVQR